MFFLQVINKSKALITEMTEVINKQVVFDLTKHNFVIENGEFNGSSISSTKISISPKKIEIGSVDAIGFRIKYSSLNQQWEDFSQSANGCRFKRMITCGRNIKILEK